MFPFGIYDYLNNVTELYGYLLFVEIYNFRFDIFIYWYIVLICAIQKNTEPNQ